MFRGLLLSGESGMGLDVFLGYATTVLQWVITSLGTIINFFLQHPALLLWSIVALIGLVFIYFKKLV